MKRYKRVFLYYKLAQFLAALYIRWFRKNPSQYIRMHHKSQRISIRGKHCRYGYQSSGTIIWIGCRYAFLITANKKDVKKIVVKNRNNNNQKMTIYPVEIYPILCDEPVAFIDELSAFNLSNRKFHLDDILIETSCSSDIVDEAEPCISCGVHIALIITSFYDPLSDYSDELREYFQTPRNNFFPEPGEPLRSMIRVGEDVFNLQLASIREEIRRAIPRNCSGT
ncbi:hypothetical protein WUBG_06773 [Wuchereria bancrofti]|uniref:Uncharacterized protein n=1 Tax=Wuchereria bancrofti TaxID=6293 RepID=J9EYN5_WUCBA|nr:hypothetical protein WUBG_06773 [Wuchereria bancrofti]